MLRVQGTGVSRGAASQGSGSRCDGPRRAGVSQQSGIGRGLGALFPGSAAQRAASSGVADVGAPTGVKRMNALGEDFATTVATSESGIALIYKALDALVEQFELDDAAVVLE